MTTIETIRQEIERLYDGEAPKHDQQCDFDDGYFTGIGAVSKFLDTLTEEPDKSLEEAAEKHARFYDQGTCDGIAQDCFIAGAKWQREQMLNDAVKGKVCILPGSVAYVDERDNNALKQYIIDNFKAGDKVKIVIVKED